VDGSSRWTHCAPVPVLSLLVSGNTFSAWYRPQRSILRGENLRETSAAKLTGEAATNMHARRPKRAMRRGEKLPDGVAGEEKSRDGESALRETVPGERGCDDGVGTSVETLDSRRPLIPHGAEPGVSMFAACRTFHPAGPPLEPQGGRLHNLLRSARMNRIELNY
jgi:hypothetical protein